MKVSYITLFFVGLLSYSCVKDSDFSQPDYNQIIENKKAEAGKFEGKEIGYTALKGKAITAIEEYKEDEAFEGVVISSDEGGNFYKKLYIQAMDKSGSIAVAVEKKGIYGDFPVGSSVQVRLKGTTFWYNSKNDIVEVGYGKGVTAGGNTKMEGLPPSLYDKVLVSRGEILPLKEISAYMNGLGELKKGDYTNKLVTIANVHFDVNAVGKSYYQTKDKYNTVINLIDNNNVKMEFVTSSFAYHAKDLVPNGGVIVTAILTKYGSSEQLTISSLKDVETNK